MARSTTVLATAFLALTIAGCAETILVMKDPQTAEVAQFRAGSGPTMFPIIQNEIDKSTAENCAAGCLGAGWVRMN